MNPAPVQQVPSLPSHMTAVFSGLMLVLLLFTAQLVASAQGSPAVYSAFPFDRTSVYVKTAGDTLPKMDYRRRKLLVTGVNVIAYGGTLIALNTAWYKGYRRTSFHTFNDSREWLQMDKLGHAWSVYNAGRATTAMWQWAGVPDKNAAWLGGLTSMAYLTTIECFDAYSAKWGWSWSDIAANTSGAAMYLSQQLGWKEQRIQLKFSFHPKRYTDPQLAQRGNELFGDPWYERMLKDYNAQTYWISVNPRSFWRNSNLPRWLNIAIGYGANGMFGGFENRWVDGSGNNIVRNDIRRTRQFYLSPDIDFTKIPTKSRFLRTAFACLNAFKCPAPALLIDSQGKFRAYAIYF